MHALTTAELASGTTAPAAPASGTLVGHLPETIAADVWQCASDRVREYGFAIEHAELEAPRTGTFDGLRIVLDRSVSLEIRCFILLHLFGHSVQWTAPSLDTHLDELQHTADRARFMAVLRAYEFQAAEFGLQLLHEAGVLDLDRWYFDFVETDWRYVRAYYETGRIPAWSECVAVGGPIIQPRPIPPLVHRQVAVRFAF